MRQCALGLFHEKGRGGVPLDEGEAGNLYRRAAHAGYAPAQYNLALYSDKVTRGLSLARSLAHSISLYTFSSLPLPLSLTLSISLSLTLSHSLSLLSLSLLL
jgi:TPR repeat protein